MAKFMKKTAAISADSLYRYALSRIWDEEKGLVTFVALNPSTADADEDDPTIRRLVNFTKSWGYGGFHVVNLFAYRATNPKQLKKVDDPIGSENNNWIKQLVSKSRLNVVCWGNGQGLKFDGRDKEILNLIKNPHCISVTNQGNPGHPGRLPEGLKPKPYSISG